MPGGPGDSVHCRMCTKERCSLLKETRTNTTVTGRLMKERRTEAGRELMCKTIDRLLSDILANISCSTITGNAKIKSLKLHHVPGGKDISFELTMQPRTKFISSIRIIPHKDMVVRTMMPRTILTSDNITDIMLNTFAIPETTQTLEEISHISLVKLHRLRTGKGTTL